MKHTLVLFERARKNAAAIRRIGQSAREEARLTGTSIFYVERSAKTQIIEEHSDGRRERVTAGSDKAYAPVRSFASRG